MASNAVLSKEIRELKEAHALLAKHLAQLERLRLAVHGKDWDVVAETLRTRCATYEGKLRKHTNPDWRELGEAQGRLCEVLEILGFPTNADRDIAATAERMRQLEAKIETYQKRVST